MSTINNKGQVTIPVAVRVALGVELGGRVELVEVEQGRFELIAARHSITALKGMVRKPALPITVESMNQAIAKQSADLFCSSPDKGRLG